MPSGTHTNRMFLGSGVNSLFEALGAHFRFKQMGLAYAELVSACKKACCCEAEMGASMIYCMVLPPLHTFSKTANACKIGYCAAPNFSRLETQLYGITTGCS